MYKPRSCGVLFVDYKIFIASLKILTTNEKGRRYNP